MKLTHYLFCLVQISLSVCSAYNFGFSHRNKVHAKTYVPSSLFSFSREKHSRRVAIQSGVATVFGLGSAWLTNPSEARAERTLATVTESYNRYVPRMVKGFRYLNDTIPVLIEQGDVNEVISEITAEKGTTISAMKGTMRVSLLLTDSKFSKEALLVHGSISLDTWY